MKHSKSGGVTLRISNQRSNVPSPVHQGGTNNTIRGSVDLAKVENVTSVDLKECAVSICLSPSCPISSLGMGYKSEWSATGFTFLRFLYLA